MNSELFSYDKYKGFNIFINDDLDFFYGDVYFNGTQMERDIKGISAESCLQKCKDKVDSIIHYEMEHKEQGHE